MNESKDKENENCFIYVEDANEDYIKAIGLEGAREGDILALKVIKILSSDKGNPTYYLKLANLRLNMQPLNKNLPINI